MSTFLLWVANAVISLGILSMFLILMLLIFRGETLTERLIRCLSLLAGFLVFLSAKLLKLSIPQLLYSAAETGGLIESTAWSMIVPAGVGVAMAAYFANVLRRGGDRQISALIVISTLVFCGFCDVFVTQIVKDQKSEKYSRAIQSMEDDRNSRYSELENIRSSYETVEQWNAKRDSIKENIAKLDREIEATEGLNLKAKVVEFGPNVLFILGVLFYVIFVLDRGSLSSHREKAEALEHAEG